MKKGLFEFIVVSASDREKLTCEICFKNQIFAEISQETGELLVEIYPPETNKCWEIPFFDLQQAIEDGKNFLLDDPIKENK